MGGKGGRERVSEEKGEREEVVDGQKKCIHMHSTLCGHGQVVEVGNFAQHVSPHHTQCPCMQRSWKRRA